MLSPAGAGTGAGAGAGEEAQAKETVDETAAKNAEAATTDGKPDFDQTKIESFPQPIHQKDAYWDSITPEQLVWYKGCPALVVPKSRHFHVPCGKPEDGSGVIAYGPSAKNVEPLKKRERVYSAQFERNHEINIGTSPQKRRDSNAVD